MSKKLAVLISAAGAAMGRLAVAQPTNAFVQTNLVANKLVYDPSYATADPHMEDAWGIATRPAGAGGHIWVDNAFDGSSSEYIGDVNGTPLYQDGLKNVTLDNPQFTDRGSAFVTGLVYNAGSDLAGQGVEFPVSGPSYNANTGVAYTNGYSGPSKFIFVTEDGSINAWASNTANAMDSAPVVLDYSKTSNNFGKLGDVANPVYSGVAITTNPVTPQQVGTSAGNHLYAADFRNNKINVFDDQWHDVSSSYSFQTPSNLIQVGTTSTPLHVFNIQNLGGHLFATYAAFNTQGDEGQEEIDQNGDGAVVEYNTDGTLVREFTDSTDEADELDAPWGVAIAPANWGPFGGDLLVTNFGDNGTISVFNTSTGNYVGKLDDTSGDPISVDGIWGLTFGNGLSLGDSNSLYFTAGPNFEYDGIFGKITVAPVPEPASMGLIGFACLSLLGRRRRQ